MAVRSLDPGRPTMLLISTMGVQDLKIGALGGIVELALDAVAMKGRRGYRSGIRPNDSWEVGEARQIVGRCKLLSLLGAYEPLPSAEELRRLGETGNG
jgi:hypothetical protein